jgi:hypothetical protein
MFVKVFRMRAHKKNQSEHGELASVLGIVMKKLILYFWYNANIQKFFNIPTKIHLLLEVYRIFIPSVVTTDGNGNFKKS